VVEFVKKYISIEKTVWNELKVHSSLPENRRAVGDQAGIVIKECLKSFEDKKISREIHSNG